MYDHAQHGKVDNFIMDESEAKEVYEQSLREEHAKMLAAMQSEFNLEDADELKQAVIARKKVVEIVPDAAEAVKYLVNHAESEAVRGNMAKFVLQTGMQLDSDADPADPMGKLFDRLRKNDAKDQPVHE